MKIKRNIIVLLMLLMPSILLCNDFLVQPQKIQAFPLTVDGIDYLGFKGGDIDYITKLVIGYPTIYSTMNDYKKLSLVDNSISDKYKSKYKKTKTKFIIFGIVMGAKDVAITAGLIYLGSQVIKINI